jgi:hypothetical protein
MQTAFSSDGARPPCRPSLPPEATSQPCSHPRGRLAGRQLRAARSARRAAGAGSQAQADWCKRLGLAWQ